MTAVKNYLSLAKYRMVMGNSFVVAAGFIFAAQTQIDATLLASALAGMALIMASGCVFNNYIDRDIDALMGRTQDRALVEKSISPRNAIIYGSVLGISGMAILISYTNALTAYAAFLGFFFYVALYSIWKRRSSFGAAVGSVAGAVPPVAGYVAASGAFDTGAVLLFLILCFWQMPHFFAISLRRMDDYASASIPVLPLERGARETKKAMLAYIALFSVTVVLPSAYGYTGYFYLAVMATLNCIWIVLSVQGFTVKNDVAWARAMFVFSLVVLMSLCMVIPIDAFVRIT